MPTRKPAQNATLANGTMIRITDSQIVAGKKRYQKSKRAPNAAAAAAARAASSSRTKRVRTTKKVAKPSNWHAPNAAAAAALAASMRNATKSPSPARKSASWKNRVPVYSGHGSENMGYGDDGLYGSPGGTFPDPEASPYGTPRRLRAW